MPTSARHPTAATVELLVLVDADCGLCSSVALWLRRVDVFGRLRIVALQDVPEGPDVPSRDRLLETIHVRDGRGRWWTGAAACLQVAERVPLLWPFALLGRVPAVALLMEHAYARVARDRRRLSVRLGLAGCRLPRDS
jgi:predicted DCC family thiol-disulfide oxidoreductase YuxK